MTGFLRVDETYGIAAMHAAATGMKALDTKLDVVANNLANINTVGFKRSRTNFEDLFYQTIREPGARDANDEPAPHGIRRVLCDGLRTH